MRSGNTRKSEREAETRATNPTTIRNWGVTSMKKDKKKRKGNQDTKCSSKRSPKRKRRLCLLTKTKKHTILHGGATEKAGTTKKWKEEKKKEKRNPSPKRKGNSGARGVNFNGRRKVTGGGGISDSNTRRRERGSKNKEGKLTGAELITQKKELRSKVKGKFQREREIPNYREGRDRGPGNKKEGVSPVKK